MMKGMLQSPALTSVNALGERSFVTNRLRAHETSKVDLRYSHSTMDM